ncbi:MAG: DUF3570 domain-containing protein [Sandaracinaceae bacterium]
MRLQLMGCALAAGALLGCGAPPAGRAVSADVRGAVYQDTDQTTIGTVVTAIRGRPSSEVTLTAREVVDITTSASVDVVSAATGRWDEARSETMGGVTWADGWTTLDVAYVYSAENDWWSHAGSFGLRQDLADHDVSLTLGGRFVWNDIGRSGDPTFHREQLGLDASAGVVWVASPESLFSISYGLMTVHGYQVSPYRYVRVRAQSDAPLPLSTPERAPADRYRHALVLRWNHAPDPNVAVRTHARLYADDWGVFSVTAGTEVRGQVDQTELGLALRAHAQTGASFFRDVYDTPLVYMTSDRELSPLVDVFAGPSIGWRGPAGDLSELRLEARAMLFGFWLFEFSRLPERYGVVGELAVGGDL